MHTTDIEAVIDWATKFARCVRDRDFEGGQALFPPMYTVLAPEHPKLKTCRIC